MDITERCRIHMKQCDEEGLYTRGNVLQLAEEEIVRLRRINTELLSAISTARQYLAIYGDNEAEVEGEVMRPLEYPLAPNSEWYGDANYKQTGGDIHWMSPDQFLSQVRPLQIDEASRDNIDDLKNHIKSGRKLDPLQISKTGKEDGRHRAHAAKELGIKQVPVLRWVKKAAGGEVDPISAAIAKAEKEGK